MLISQTSFGGETSCSVGKCRLFSQANSDIAYNRYMCLDLFLQETPCGSILVNNLLLEVTNSSLPFGWSFMGGLTVLKKY